MAFNIILFWWLNSCYYSFAWSLLNENILLIEYLQACGVGFYRFFGDAFFQ